MYIKEKKQDWFIDVKKEAANQRKIFKIMKTTVWVQTENMMEHYML